MNLSSYLKSFPVLVFIIWGTCWILACQPPAPPPPVLVDPTAAEDAIIGSTFNFPSLPQDYEVHTEPPHAQSPNTSVSDPDAVRLGRVLFYDKNLSVDGTVSCASCHQQGYAFGDNRPRSIGVGDRETLRNTIPMGTFLNYLPYHTIPNGLNHRPLLGWDELTKSSLEFREIHLGNPTIMDLDLDEAAERLSSIPYYPILYRRAYPNESGDMKTNFLFGGLTSFIWSLNTQNSRFDGAFKAVVDKDYWADFPNFSESENRGKQLFLTHCASCHGNHLGYDIAAEFNQLDGFSACNGLDETYEDKGIGALYDHSPRYGFFRVPSLRNIEVTAPYMHDGRFQTLRQVLEFYNSGIQAHPNLHSLLQDSLGAPLRLELSDPEIDALEAFLLTLTDQKILSSPKWADPFRP